jgi:hypothetical protein
MTKVGEKSRGSVHCRNRGYRVELLGNPACGITFSALFTNVLCFFLP